jgi:hypothetical protein
MPAGYDYGPDRALMISADESVRRAVSEVFGRFGERTSVGHGERPPGQEK